MKPDLKTFISVAAVLTFVVLPLMLYAMGDFPHRSLFKEGLSVATILAFMLVLGQFFLARSNATLLSLFNPRKIQQLHKYIAYFALSILLLHPVLIVLPRYFEAGVKPFDALILMLTSFDKLGVVLGMIAWVLMLVLGASAMFRMALIKRFSIKYRNWRYFHGGLSLGFVGLATWHSIELGRHTTAPMAVLMIGLAMIAALLLIRLYRDAVPRAVPNATLSAGAK